MPSGRFPHLPSGMPNDGHHAGHSRAYPGKFGSGPDVYGEIEVEAAVLPSMNKVIRFADREAFGSWNRRFGNPLGVSQWDQHLTAGRSEGNDPTIAWVRTRGILQLVTRWSTTWFRRGRLMPLVNPSLRGLFWLVKSMGHWV